MTQLTEEQINILKEVAKNNEGHCDRCGRKLGFYSYNINEVQSKLLRKMADNVRESGINVVNLNEIDAPYSMKTQRTKMRLHGLIAKHKKDGVQVASEWVITTKGFHFLAGKEIPLSVSGFDNQVMGHSVQTTTINRITGDDILYEERLITTEEAEIYHDVRNTRKNVSYYATFKGKNVSGFDNETVYTVEIDGLRTGKPIQMFKPFEYKYQDILQFQKNWKVIKEIK